MIDILMATYNGEQYLEEQLDSILQQSYQNWTLIIRDDCSKDNTVEIIKKYQQQYPEKIVLLQAESPSGSAQNNFFELIRYERMYRDAEYIMFSDQDDVWLFEKIQHTLNCMKKVGQQYAEELPLLVHTDLKVVDAALNEISPSLFAMQNMDYRLDKFNNILVQNVVAGCTMMVNRALLSYLDTIPKNAIMHDMWLALIASAFGKIGFVEQTTMLYRQHGKNASGAKDVNSLRYFIWEICRGKKIHSILVTYYRQASEFCRVYEGFLTDEQKTMLKAYASLEKKGIIKKYCIIKKYKLFKKGMVRKIGQILC